MNMIRIYDLNNLSFLENDIQDILTKIDALYFVDFKNDLFQSRTQLDKSRHWTSDDSNLMFNTLVPKIKTLTKDMYAIIEAIHRDELGKYDKNVIKTLESKYSDFREFRLLNNKFKHHNDANAEIQVAKIVLMDGVGQYIDIHVGYKYQDRFNGKMFFEFIRLFFKILEDKKMVIINRTN